jgi:hypothetical protein
VRLKSLSRLDLRSSAPMKVSWSSEGASSARDRRYLLKSIEPTTNAVVAFEQEQRCFDEHHKNE